MCDWRSFVKHFLKRVPIRLCQIVPIGCQIRARRIPEALLFLIIGNGFFKPNISTQVGNLYSATDPRRDRAYMIFYMGVNLGAFFAPVVCSIMIALSQAATGLQLLLARGLRQTVRGA